jgi:hypothetical protein
MTSRIALLLLALVPLATYPADVYQWVDEKGRRHFGDNVPPQYQHKATKRNSRVTGPTTESVNARKDKEGVRTAESSPRPAANVPK